MFTVLTSERLWIGTDLKRFNEIRDILDSQNIKYKYKAVSYTHLTLPTIA